MTSTSIAGSIGLISTASLRTNGKVVNLPSATRAAAIAAAVVIISILVVSRVPGTPYCYYHRNYSVYQTQSLQSFQGRSLNTNKQPNQVADRRAPSAGHRVQRIAENTDTDDVEINGVEQTQSLYSFRGRSLEQTSAANRRQHVVETNDVERIAVQHRRRGRRQPKHQPRSTNSGLITPQLPLFLSPCSKPVRTWSPLDGVLAGYE